MTRNARGRRENDGAARNAPTTTRAEGRQQRNRPKSPSSDDTRTGVSQASSSHDHIPRLSFWRRFLHDRTVRARIGALVLLPLVATLVLGAFFVKNALDDASASGRVETLASVGLTAADAFYAIQDERDTTILIDAGGESDQSISDVRTVTDRAVEELRDQVAGLDAGDLGPDVAEAISAFERDIDRLADYRKQHDDIAPLTDVALQDNYHNVAGSVQGIIVAASSVVADPESARLLRALNDISQTTESASMERGAFSYFIQEGENIGADQQELGSALQAEQQLLIDNFLSNISNSTLRVELSDEISSANRKITAERRDINDRASARSTNEEWFANASSRIEELRDIERSIAEDVVDDASATASSARLTATVSAVAVLVILVLTALLTLVVARSIIGPLRRLRGAALDTAKTNLPALVNRIQQDGPAAAKREAMAVQPEGRDEIGQVATAFNDVHATAVRIAGEQALLRQNLDTIVVNLSRRTQSLIDRQLTEVEGLEARERDPDQLSTLFRIDHIATRVRRHAESLLVLAGVEEMRKQSAASAVLDVVRAAVGEVEQYPRVEFGVMPTDLVAASAVDDVSHLLAELIDNATEFSAPSTPVTVTSQPLLGGGLRIQVTDTGLGIPPDQLADLNNRLTGPGDIDVAASRTLGLYVVARLAAKHGIQVRLESGAASSPGTGTVAQVDLPSVLILSPLDTTEGVVPSIDGANTDQSATVGGPGSTNPEPAPLMSNTAVEPLTAGTDSGLPRRPVGADTPGDAAQPFPPNPTPPLTSRPKPGEPTHRAPVGTSAGYTPSVPSGSLWADDTTPAPTTNGTNGTRPPVRPDRPSLDTPSPDMPSLDLAAGAGTTGSPTPDERQLRAPEPQLPSSGTPVYDAVRSAWFNKDGMSQDWTSPADEGWRRAAEVLRAAEEAATERKQRDQGPAGSSRPAPPPSAGAPPSRLTPLPPRPAQQPRHGAERPQPPTARPAQPAASWTSGGQPGPAAAEPILNESGLPVRRKGASLVPGSVEALRQGTEDDDETMNPPTTSQPTDAGSVKSSLSSLQRGVSRGREETGGWVPKRPGGQERSSS